MTPGAEVRPGHGERPPQDDRGRGRSEAGSDADGRPGTPARLARALRGREPLRLPDGVAAARAAVTLLLRPGPEALFVRRVEVAADPWSGHVALPGGRSDLADADLLDTARRELREETGIVLDAEAFLGRLDDLRPLSRRLPSIAVTPFVAWAEEPATVRTNRELSAHVWIPVETLRDPEHRTVLELEREGRRLVFPAVEYRGYTVWGLTFEIVKDFLRLLERAGREEG